MPLLGGRRAPLRPCQVCSPGTFTTLFLPWPVDTADLFDRVCCVGRVCSRSRMSFLKGKRLFRCSPWVKDFMTSLRFKIAFISNTCGREHINIEKCEPIPLLGAAAAERRNTRLCVGADSQSNWDRWPRGVRRLTDQLAASRACRLFFWLPLVQQGPWTRTKARRPGAGIQGAGDLGPGPGASQGPGTRDRGLGPGTRDRVPWSGGQGPGGCDGGRRHTMVLGPGARDQR